MNFSILSNKYKVSVEYIKKLDSSVKKLSPTFNSRNLEDVLRSFLKLELFNKGNKGNTSHVNFVTPTDCKFINLKQMYGKGGTWFFGSHSKNKNDILVGYIEVLPAFGVILLSDKSYSIACVILPSSTLNISTYLNKCVIVKNYRVFTESYNDPNTINAEYFCFKICDMEVVESDHVKLAKPENKSKNICNITLRCRIIRKSVVCLSQMGIPEIWFEIEVITPNQLPRNEFLCFGLNLIKIGMFLERGKEYILFSSKPRKGYTNIEIKRFRPNLPSWKIDDTSLFVKSINSCKSYKEDVLSVHQAITNIKTKSHGMLISFQGELHCKTLVKPLSSRTKSSSVVGFGTLGPDTHVLEFQTKAGETLVLYLNNWERSQIPLGLIPGMEILIRDVTVQSNRYYKSTIFTSFEVKNYCPKVKFDTVNLYTEEELITDKFSYLGFGDRLPPNIMIWARISNIKIRSLKLMISCIRCLTNYCYCGSNTADITVKLTFFVIDEFGETLVIANDLEVLRLILNFSQHSWEDWCNAIRKYGTFNYNRESYPKQTDCYKKDLFADRLYYLIRTINVRSSYSIDVKCKKMVKKYDPRYEYIPTFYCLEARSNSLY